jgi:hypothetical protein
LIWQQLQNASTVWNAHRNALVNLLSFRHTSAAEAVATASIGLRTSQPIR